MKLLCAPHDSVSDNPKGYHIRIALYGRAITPNTISLGASDLQKIVLQQFVIPQNAWDLLSIAFSIVGADIAVRRNTSYDGWTRHIEMSIAVKDPDFWTTQSSLLESQLRFLTTDHWSLEFVRGGQISAPINSGGFFKPTQNCVCLLSGGLDSFVGAIDLVSTVERKPLLVSHVSKGDKARQAQFAAIIGNGLPRLEYNHNARCSFQRERSQRARSFLFLVYGVIAATALQNYHEGGEITLYVCENGFISINPPLTRSRIGSLSTRTTHPAFIQKFQHVLDAANLRVKVDLPYQLLTKGQMLRSCSDQNLLKKHAASTTSCSRFVRFQYRHCGRCVPCLIRRAAFQYWEVTDTTSYAFDELGRKDLNRARFDDVRAAAVAVAEAKNEGIERWLRPRVNIPNSLDYVGFKRVAQQGLYELAEFLRVQGVS